MTEGILKLEGKLTEFKVVESKSKDTYYTFKVADQAMSWWPQYSTKDWAPDLLALVNKWVLTEYTETQKGTRTYKNMVSISPAEKTKESPLPASAAGAAAALVDAPSTAAVSQVQKPQPPIKDYQRESIEMQTAFKGIIELLVGKVILPDSNLGKAALAWAERRLGSTPTVKQPASPPVEPKKDSPVVKEPAPETKEDNALAPIKGIQDLYDRYKALDPGLPDKVVFELAEAFKLAGKPSWGEIGKLSPEEQTDLWIKVLATWGAKKGAK